MFFPFLSPRYTFPIKITTKIYTFPIIFNIKIYTFPISIKNRMELPIGQLVGFIRKYSITETPDGSLINNACKSNVLEAIKKRYALSKLDNAYLRKKDVDDILNAELFFD